MRGVGVLVVLALTLGFGFASGPAAAAPCPFHASDTAVAGPEALPARVEAPTAAAPEMPAAAAVDQLTAGTQRPVPDHAVPEGQFCCHVAAAVAPACRLELAPSRRRAVPSRVWLPPRPAPAADIYRPPAFG